MPARSKEGGRRDAWDGNPILTGHSQVLTSAVELQTYGRKADGTMARLGFLQLALLPVVASAQQNSGFHAPWVSCTDSTRKFVGPKSVQTETLRSADGKHRAYAEISAAIDAHSECGNTV